MSTLSPLMSASALQETLASSSDIRVFDASFYLPAEHKDAKSLYKEAHIPGAGFFDIAHIADRESGYPNMLPSPEQFEAHMQALGIANSDSLVFYDQKGLFSAARAWWMMTTMGHQHVYVLDGGLPGWVAAGYPTCAESPAVRSGEAYVARVRPERIAMLFDVQMQLHDNETCVVDARSPSRFHGELPEARPGVRAGHIPGSLNLHYATLFQEDGIHLKAADTLREKLEGILPLAPETSFIMSCGSGVTACILALVMAHCGFTHPVAVYDGSWAEWGSYAEADLDLCS